MTKFIIITAIAAAIGLPSIAVAQTSPIQGPIGCRPARAGETANANVQNTQLVCSPVNVDTNPNATPVTPATASPQTNVNSGQKAKKPYPNLYPGFDGNPND
jgi:hypothetical protein